MRFTRSKQQGITTVEFAIVGMVLMITLFGALEIGRLLFVYSFLEEATRRGARAATVCQVGDTSVADIAAFDSGSGSSIVNGLSSANFNVEYLDLNGAVIGDTGANYANIEFVRVSLVNFQHQVNIPLLNQVLDAPAFATTLPRESLGVSREGISAC